MSDPALTAPPTARRRLLTLFGRHQLAAAVATAVDFAVMVVAVEAFGLWPALATFTGAGCGALTNFQLGRHWIFQAQREAALPQALRYALVSGASAALNALGEYVLHHRLGVGYLAARVAVSVTVSLLWNFPMHRHFVFRRKGGA